MNRHAGYIKNINGIEYNITSIPEGVTLYPEWSDEIDCNSHSLKCIQEEIIHTLETDTNTKLICTYANFFQITPTRGMPPIALKESYTVRAFYNCKHPGVFHIKHNTTQKKYTFTIDKNMLLVLYDPMHEYIVGCPYSSSEETNRSVFSFSFKNEF